MSDIKPLARHARPAVVEALADTRVVLISGARQVGKSTLAAAIARREHPARLLSLDDKGLRAAATTDPKGFLARHDGPVVIDEIQRVPELLLAIKQAVDVDPTPGRFLLTGSANILTAPRVLDSLAGRIETVTLWPLSQGELAGVRERFVDLLLEGRPPRVEAAAVGIGALADTIARGGFPEVVVRQVARRRASWFESYLRALMSRDIRDLADIRLAGEIPKLLRLLATRTGGVIQPANLSHDLALGKDAVDSYVRLLETMYAIHRVPAWRPGLGTRVVRAPKAYVVDSGMLTHLLDADPDRIADDVRVTGLLLESFVAMELTRQLGWADAYAQLRHFRDKDGYEVDFVLESNAGTVAGVEVKSRATVRASDFKGLKRLRRLAGDSFTCGVVLHTGDRTLPFGDDLWAVPVAGLWAGGDADPTRDVSPRARSARG